MALAVVWDSLDLYELYVLYEDAVRAVIFVCTVDRSLAA